MKQFWKIWGDLIIAGLIMWFLLTCIAVTVGSFIERAGGLQCWLAPAWNAAAPKPEGCK